MRLLICGLALVGTACTEELSPSEQEMENQQAVAMVEAVNSSAPPLQEVVPETILYPDIERHDMFGVSCAYAPGTSLGPRVIAREADAFMKLEGEVIRFAADPGARELPYGTRSSYNGRAYSLRVDVAGEGEQTDPEVREYEGTITLRDRYDRIIYSGVGTAQCGS